MGAIIKMTEDKGLFPVPLCLWRKRMSRNFQPFTFFCKLETSSYFDQECTDEIHDACPCPGVKTK